MKKVCFLLADGFEETEFVAPWDLLLRAGADVTVLSVSKSLYVTGAHGLCVKADMLINESSCKWDMAVLPGGGKGTENLGNSEEAAELVKQTFANGGFVCAICAAPTVLASLGLLDGVEATCFPSMRSEMKNAKLSEQNVVRDGNIITGSSMGVAFDFGLALVDALFGKENAQNTFNSSLGILKS